MLGTRTSCNTNKQMPIYTLVHAFGGLPGDQN